MKFPMDISDKNSIETCKFAGSLCGKSRWYKKKIKQKILLLIVAVCIQFQIADVEDWKFRGSHSCLHKEDQMNEPEFSQIAEIPIDNLGLKLKNCMKPWYSNWNILNNAIQFLVDCLKNKQVICSCFVLRYKCNPDRTLKKCKACLTARVFLSKIRNKLW